MSETDTRDRVPFHKYDLAMRLWAEPSAAGVAAWLDPSVSGVPPGQVRTLGTAFIASTIHADLLYVLMLGAGTVEGFDDLARFGFAIDVRVIYVRDGDPAGFLADPLLAPFAVLARGGAGQREEYLGAAFRVLRDSGHPRKWALVQVAETLAQLWLDRSVIERIGRENGVNLEPLIENYRESQMGRWIENIGREEGREEGRERMLSAVLRSQFGDLPQVGAVARRLAGWDETAAATAVREADDLQSLLTLPRPTG